MLITTPNTIKIVQCFFVYLLYLTLFLMSKKFCPLGFFSFYVNKSQAQAGAGHHCVEESCALWNEEYEECSLKVGLDSIVSLAENFGSGQGLSTPERRIEVEAPKLSIFDKLRRKTEGQRLPTADTTIQTSIPVTTQTSTPVTTQTSTPLATSTSTVTPPVILPPPPPPPSAPLAILLPTVSTPNELLKPPDVPLEALPIISITSKEN